MPRLSLRREKEVPRRRLTSQSNPTQQGLQQLDVDRLIDEEHAPHKIGRVLEQLDSSRFESETLAVERAAGRPSHSLQELSRTASFGCGRRPDHRKQQDTGFGGQDEALLPQKKPSPSAR